MQIIPLFETVEKSQQEDEQVRIEIRRIESTAVLLQSEEISSLQCPSIQMNGRGYMNSRGRLAYPRSARDIFNKITSVTIESVERE